MISNEDKLDYHEYTQEKLAYIERYISLIKNREVTPDVINHALVSYEGVGNWLIKQYEDIALDYEDMKEEYQVDFDNWFLEASSKLNETRIKSKFASTTEIEATARVTHREEYLHWQGKLKIMERKVSMFRRLMDNWKNQKDMIVNLAQNSRGEMRALGIQDLANYDDRVKKEKIRK